MTIYGVLAAVAVVLLVGSAWAAWLLSELVDDTDYWQDDPKTNWPDPQDPPPEAPTNWR